MNGRPEHLTYLDGWRGLAIALVLERHFATFLPLETGRFGVDVFFCLSGFLMSGLLFVQRQPLRSFYKRRISRILPAFVFYVMAAFTWAAFQHEAFKASEVVSTLMFMRTYFPAQPGIWITTIPIGHLWSLNIEEHSYVFMSMIAGVRFFRWREGVLLVLGGVACIGIGLLYLRLGVRAPTWGALGSEVAASHLLLSAGYRLIREKHDLKVAPFWPLLAIVAAVVTYSLLVPWWCYTLFSPFLLAFAVNHLSQTYGAVKAMLSTPVLRQFGIWSFSLYLWQQPFYLYRASIPGGHVGALVGALLAAMLSFYGLEQPARAWLNKNW